MKRRSFVKASLLTGTVGTILPNAGHTTSGNAKKDPREFYELRVYSLKNESKLQAVESYFEKAAIPALNRLGSNNIGVFREYKPADSPKLYVLIPYTSMEQFLKVEETLMNDKTYTVSATGYLNAPASDPAYDRIESWLLQSFAHMPRVNVPVKNDRIFELRRYESATEAAGKKKIEMFNNAGEIDIFKRLGFNPVFFAETLIGSQRPNLTYMITFDDMEAHDRHWKAFGSDPEWKKISAIPEYADAKIVSHITSTFLKPSACSQI